jgi:hypothetical protein
MMPRFPRSPYHSVRRIFPIRLEGWLSDGAVPNVTVLKSAHDIRGVSAGLDPSFVRLVVPTVVPFRAGPLTRLRTAMKWVHHYRRDPRSDPGYRVPIRRHLINPIRPTPGHTAISPHSGLYAVPSPCGSAEATQFGRPPRRWV